MKFYKNFSLFTLAALTALFIGACSSASSSTPAAAPETTAAETKAPETTAAETKAPETTAAEAKAPETTAAETSAAETSAAESEADETAARKEEGAITLTAYNGMTFTIPAKYADFVVYDTPEDDGEYHTLLTVSEKASVEAAKKQDPNYEGAGWLFDIFRVDEERLHKMMCYDFTGMEPFAKDADGYHYFCGHPTDVRIVRENYDNMDKELVGWGELCEWANTAAETFLAENEGLEKETIGNAAPQVYLARTIWDKDSKYQVAYLEFGPLDPKDVDPEPFARRLIDDAVYEAVDISEAPDGEYYVLDFPEDNVRVDFFLGEPEENYVRHVWSEEYEELYKVIFKDKSIIASEVMSEWYHALAEANGKTSN